MRAHNQPVARTGVTAGHQVQPRCLVSARSWRAVMTKKSLILGVVTLCALPAAAFAQVLINENFNELMPRSVPNGTMINDFTYHLVTINGNINGSNAPLACTIFANPNNCAHFNGVSGTLTSKSLSLAPGDYVLASSLSDLGFRNVKLRILCLDSRSTIALGNTRVLGRGFREPSNEQSAKRSYF
jgi:hypothetical protein